MHNFVYKRTYLLQEKINFNKSKYATFINTSIKEKLI